jgi:CRISPR-associated protein Cmr4
MNINVFAIKCVTNLHVGNGDVNYNIIDNEVERDAVTNMPIINASGVKGALREHFETAWGKEDSRITSIFGPKNKEESAQGKYKFLQADMLFRPLRVTGEEKRSYILATTEEAINLFADKIRDLCGKEVNKSAFSLNEKKDGEIEVEGKKYPILSGGFGEKIAKSKFVMVDDFNDFALPVNARNVLDDSGISKNLWYEEYVPHECIFGLIIITPEGINDDFKAELLNHPVQFGGNASIGCGLTKIEEVRL